MGDGLRRICLELKANALYYAGKTIAGDLASAVLEAELLSDLESQQRVANEFAAIADELDDEAA
jgi:pyridoxal/pyridoxine/pyridoxamine kinase